MNKINRQVDFRGVISQCEVFLCMDGGSEVRFKLEGQDNSFRICHAGFRLDVGEHIQAYGSAGRLSALEVIDHESSVIFRWISTHFWHKIMKK